MIDKLLSVAECDRNTKDTPLRRKLNKPASKACRILLIVLATVTMPIGFIGVIVRAGYVNASELMGRVFEISRGGLICDCPWCKLKRGQINAKVCAKEIMHKADLPIPPEVMDQLVNDLAKHIQVMVDEKETKKTMEELFGN